MKTAVLIPAYRAEKELAHLLPVVKEFISPEHIYVVNDGHFDTTPALCRKEGVTCYNHRRNRGKGAALKTGFAWLGRTYEWVITMDADGQHRPAGLEDFFQAVSTASSRTAIICGVRKISPQIMPPMRVLSNRITSAILSLFAQQNVPDSQCGYRAYRIGRVIPLHSRYNRFEYESEVLLQCAARGYKISTLPVDTIYITDGPSHISHLRDTLRWIGAVTATQFREKCRRGAWNR
ncbi:MAG: glycosyltransferase family 2 protein [Fibrobacterota bacterium]